mgnify:CR=1 FL=1
MVIHRGDIYYADLRPVVGSEQGGVTLEINIHRLSSVPRSRAR